jgi:predicted thioesterase
MDTNITVGMIGEKKDVVTKDNTAIQYGSGSIPVYATPAMVGLMEGASINAVDPHLAEGMSTVGIELMIKHIAATPVGMAVRATAEVSEIDGKRLVFTVKAFDDKEQIGSGTHVRYIVSVQKFLQKVESKLRIN